MLFTSTDFMLFFAIVFALYYVIPPKLQQLLQWRLLLLASGFFYYMTGAENLIYIGITIVTTYVASLFIAKLQEKQSAFLKSHKQNPDSTLSKAEIKAYKSKNNTTRLLLLTACLLVNFGLLGIVKVSGLAVLGISFYIFRSMSYIIDLNRGKFTNQKDPFKFALFVSFFPLILQGPIARYDETAPALFGGNRFSFKKASFGFQRILWGVFKKMVIADRLSVALTPLFGEPDEYRGIYVLIAIFFYAITLYADFTGGIDITIGIGEALGIPIVENFNRPFLSRNIFEYWRRWHITMGRWFREYLFYPLSVCKPMLKFGGFTRKYFGEFGKRLPVYIVTLVTWFSTGIWHGVSWNFVVWGLLNGIVIIISQELEPLYKKFNSKFAFTQTRGYACFEIFRTFWMMCFIRSYDCYEGVRTTFFAHISVFSDFRLGKFMADGLSGLGLDKYDYMVVAGGVFVLLISSFIKSKIGESVSVREWLSAKPMPLRFTVYGILLFGIIIFGVYGFGYDAGHFIYTRF